MLNGHETAPAGQVLAWLGAILAPGDGQVELRATGVDGKPKEEPGATFSRLYRRSDLAALVEQAAKLSGRAEAVYFTINPIRPGVRGAVRAAGIARRRLLLIDADPTRGAPGKVSATDAEKAHAARLAADVAAYLGRLDWPAPARGDSGNGIHLLYAIDLPNNDEARELVRGVLVALAHRFDTADATIDTSVYDAGRICKLYGTLARKGEPTADRPHRASAVLEVPEGFGRAVVAREMMEAVAALCPPRTPAAVAPPPRPAPRPADGRGWSVEQRAVAYLEKCPGGVTGSRGHNQTFKTACKVGPGFNLDPDVAYRLLSEYWNPTCEPPWSDKDLRRKVDEAFRKEPRRGWLLEATRAPRAASEAGRSARQEGQEDRSAGDGDGAGDEVGVGTPAELPRFGNYHHEAYADEEGRQKLRVVAHPASRIKADLEAIVGDWPKRIGAQLFAPGEEQALIYPDKSAQLFSWIDHQAHTDWTKGSRLITQERFFEYLVVRSRRVESIEVMPHAPPMPGAFYHHPELPPPGGRLDELVDRFAPATPQDRELIKALIVTPSWGGLPGRRPAFLITAEDEDAEQGRGVGKSTLLGIVAENLYGGYIELTSKDEIEDIKTRILSPGARDVRILRIDNIKTHRFSWGDLEGLITAETISGHGMYQGEVRRPNTFTTMLTLNGASLSKDMAQRVVMIKVRRPARIKGWEDGVRAFVAECRWEILADAVALLSLPPGDLEPQSRWADWEAAVLSKVADPATCQSLILERQGVVDEGDADRDVVRDHLMEVLAAKLGDADEVLTIIPSRDMALIVSEAMRKHYETNPASSFLKGLAIPELTPFRSKKIRGWLWCGAARTQPEQPIRDVFFYKREAPVDAATGWF